MLREQLLGFAIKKLAQAYETKERLKSGLNSGAVVNYVRTMKNTAIEVVEYQWQKLRDAENGIARGMRFEQKPSSMSGLMGQEKIKKPRKSSIKPAKEISSPNADIVIAKLRADGSRIVGKNEAILGKTSLAYLVWALGHAERAGITDGISVHDVSALLYRACSIELYPINISRVVYGNSALLHQVGQHKRTRTYLLTKEGRELFGKQFMGSDILSS